jgi:PAS domain S-box-containing protein
VTPGEFLRQVYRPRPVGGAVRPVDLVLFAAIGSAYVGAAKLGLALSVAHGLITPVWAPTGIALASMILFGRRVWPAILVAAFIANATSGASIPVALAISVGNTLEAVVGSVLLARARFRPALDRVRDVLALILLAAVVSTAVSATIGVTALWIADDLSGSFGFSWFLWWSGDAMGDLLVAPFLLVLLTAPLRSIVPVRRRVEAAALLVLLAGLSAFVFLAGYWRYPHLLFPLFIWATLRFRQIGAVTSSIVVAAIAISGAVSGNTPVSGEDPTQVVQILEGLLAGIAISVLILGAVLAERADAEDRLAEAQEVAHVGSWSWDIDADRVTWSVELYRLYGIVDGSPITYESFLDVVHPNDQDRMRRAVELALADGRPFSLDYRAVAPDGRVCWLHGRGQVVLDTSGKAVRMLGTAQDITERKRLDELRDSILSAVSHELRTPLTAIVGFAQTLKERSLEPNLRTTLIENLYVQARRLEQLLADLLDLDRLRHGFVRPRFAQTDIASLVEQVVAVHRDDVHPIALRTELTHAIVDAPKVERIVDNLLVNAVRHTPPGTKIEVRVEPKDGGVVIAVDDRGPGVAREDREAIFEVFHRGTRSDHAPGTGIGLSLVAQFAALHGGRAWVDDNPGGGASFRVFLPSTSSDRRESSGQPSAPEARRRPLSPAPHRTPQRTGSSEVPRG